MLISSKRLVLAVGIILLLLFFFCLGLLLSSKETISIFSPTATPSSSSSTSSPSRQLSFSWSVLKIWGLLTDFLDFDFFFFAGRSRLLTSNGLGDTEGLELLCSSCYCCFDLANLLKFLGVPMIFSILWGELTSGRSFTLSELPFISISKFIEQWLLLLN